jgi:hypothetical protein
MARESPAEKIARLERYAMAWEKIAPDQVFYGYTLEKFKSIIRPSSETRAQLRDLERRTRHTLARRNAADRTSLRAARHVVFSVMGHPEHGADGALYAAMGFIPTSARRKPGRRKK